jgi:hypothetical protein
MSALLVMSWEQFIYELSSLGFVYDKTTNSWDRVDGAAASDEALRDLHAHWPVLASAALKLYAEGKKTVSVESAWETGAFVARLKAVE